MALYEFRQVPGAGTATFATQDIPHGTIVMDEEPLLAITMPDDFNGPNDPFVIWNEFQSLTDENQRKFRSLFYSTASLEKARRTMRDMLGEHDSTTLEWSPDMKEIAMVTAIFDTNAFAVHDDAPFQAAVYAKQSRLNHMCANNCFQDTQPSGRQHMRAQRDIQKGEELTTQYIPVDEDQPAREYYCEPYGFVCACPLCEIELYLKANPGLDDSYDDMVKYFQRWFHHVQDKLTEEAQRSMAYKAHIEFDDAKSYFSMALTLLGNISGEDGSNYQVIQHVINALRASNERNRE